MRADRPAVANRVDVDHSSMLLPCLQLAWACEAFVLDSEGAPEPVQGSVLEVLERANIMWVLLTLCV
jgi:hypothetical protein